MTEQFTPTTDDLRKIAENATPGPWEVATMKASSEFGDYEVHGIKGVATPVWYSDSDMAHTALEDMGLADAEFIAAFNPETVLALLDRVETAERALQRVREALARHPECDRYEGGGPISCGWKYAVADITSALEGDE